MQYTPDVALGERGLYTPPPTEPGAERLNAIFSHGLAALQENVPNPFERATAFFLFGSLQQFFFDGNERASRFMMNGALMMEGIDAISIPAMRAAEFNSKMVEFYTTRDATQMIGFVLECHPEFDRIRNLNPELSLVRDAPPVRRYRFDDPLPQADYASAPVRHEPELPVVPREDRAEAPKRRLCAEELRRRAGQNWRRLYGPRPALQTRKVTGTSRMLHAADRTPISSLRPGT